MNFDFSGQHVIVTGASRGIGRAISIAFLRHGASLIGVYGGNSQAADELRAKASSLPGSLSLFQCDVSSETEVRRLFKGIGETVDSLDVLVNNAGIRRDSVLALMDAGDWRRVLDVNLTGSFLMAKEAVLMMMQKKYGRIVNITSPVSHLGFVGQANYAASKAGQIGMTRSLAKETARKKITVNCVSPGFIATDFIDDLSADQLAEYKKMVPMRRFGRAEEVADTVLFLSSKTASYITGAVIDVNGGL